jgi:hypothetical protein
MAFVDIAAGLAVTGISSLASTLEAAVRVGAVGARAAVAQT